MPEAPAHITCVQWCSLTPSSKGISFQLEKNESSGGFLPFVKCHLVEGTGWFGEPTLVTSVLDFACFFPLLLF